MSSAANHTRSHCWSNSSSQLAILVAQNKINIYDTHSSELSQDLVVPFQQSHGSVYSCINFNKNVKNSTTATPKKKQKKANGDEKITEGTEFLAAGTMDGRVRVWNTTRGELVKEFQLPTTSQEIVSVEFVSGTSKLLVATSAQLFICENFESGSEALKPAFKLSQNQQISSIYAGEKYLGVGTTNQTKLLEINTLKEEITLAGQSSPATQIRFLGDIVVTSAQDRMINIYKLNKNKSQNPVTVLTLDSSPVHVDLCSSADGSIIYVAATSQNGEVRVWKLPKTDLQKKSNNTPSTTLKMKEGASILSAKLTDQQQSILVVFGTFLNPTIEAVKIVDSSNNLIKDISVAQTKAKKVRGVESKITEEQGAKHDKSSILGPVNMETPNARYKQAFGDILNRPTSSVSASSLEKKILDLKQDDSEDSSVPTLKLTSSLIQALKSGDKSMIKNCLNESDPSLIQTTVKKLPSQHVIPLLEAILERYQEVEMNSFSLIYWLRYILVLHTSAIMGQPLLLNKLSPFYHALSQRLNSFSLLLDVSGRLDLLLTLAGAKPIGIDTPADDLNDVDLQDLEESSLDKSALAEDSDDDLEGALNGSMEGDDDDNEDEDDVDDLDESAKNLKGKPANEEEDEDDAALEKTLNENYAKLVGQDEDDDEEGEEADESMQE